MPPIIKVEDQNICVATSQYPYANWKFENFNPVQSRIMDFFDKEVNGLVAASTSAGKTVVAEMFLADEVRRRGGKGMFLAPLRALAREKVTDWKSESHHFNDLNISICTGDYRLTKERTKELNDSNLVIMTSEMLSHRSRNASSEQNNWLSKVGTLVVDESHLLTVEGRGDHLEVGLMNFSKSNPNARIVLLSATMPNVEEIAEWISYSLTGRETFVLRSEYRPVPLTTHYEPYSDDVGRYDLVEREKINKALDIIEWYKNDKFLVFAHTKRTGEMMKKHLLSAGIDVQFHNADLNSDQRAKVEDRFKNDPKLRVIVATSTLAWGLNLPARRVIILGVNRGTDIVESHDILQMIGRSGRYGIDPMGDAYILVPESKQKEMRQRYSKSKKIESQLLTVVNLKYKTLAFHLVSEIVNGNISTIDDVDEWFKRTLAHFQNKVLDDKVVEKTLESLCMCKAIYQKENSLAARPVGKIASLFYMSPFDVGDLFSNFTSLFENKREADEYYLSMALAMLDSNWTAIVSRQEKDEMQVYANKVRGLFIGKKFMDGVLRAGYCYFNMLHGRISPVFSSFQRVLQADYSRLSQVLQALDQQAGKWNKSLWFKALEARIVYGVDPHLIDLCQVPNIGKVRAEKLYAAGITTAKQFVATDISKLSNILNMKPEKIQEMIGPSQSLEI